MDDIVVRLRDSRYGAVPSQRAEAADEIERLRSQLVKAQEVIGWVEGWISNPVGSYSVAALDGLFGITRDKIAAADIGQRISLPDDLEKPASFCSRCGGSDPDCYICGKSALTSAIREDTK